MTFAEQVEGSVNIVGGSLATLLRFPIGLRYHGLHHLFPSLLITHWEKPIGV